LATVVKLGYALSSEEHSPHDLVRYAYRAEEDGFSFALISDHYHPWIDRQGHSPFVWSVLGAIAHATSTLQVGTGVTCPIIRIHPAIIAQAAATVAAMMPGRFFLGIGTGENLNEHVVGEGWPAYEIRAEMLEEAVEVLRLLWEGGTQSHYGQYYTVENARLYTLPDTPPPIMIAAGGKESAQLAGRIGEGLISTSPDAELVEIFSTNGHKKQPRFGQITVCCGEDENQARKIAHEYWPTAALHGTLNQELPTPQHFEQAAKNVREEDIAETIICGNKVQRHLGAIQEYVDAGFDHIYIHQVGPDQEEFFRFYSQHIIPALKEVVSR
jgi:coenzyme F420-dependent glucose-6-phosphate dehydrogenase